MASCSAVFGGSGGLGTAVVRRLAVSRPVLIGYNSNQGKAAELVDELTAQGRTVAAHQVDVRDAESVKAFVAAADAFEGGLGSVVNAGGREFPMVALTDGEESTLRAVLETDVLGNFNVLKACAPVLAQRGGGSVVMFLTTAIVRTLDFDGMNSVPKSAMRMMLRQYAREAGPKNVRVNGVAPGVIDLGHDFSLAPPLVEQVVNECIKGTPLPRLGKPEEVAALVAFLCSDDAAYINGQVICVDGGFSA